MKLLIVSLILLSSCGSQTTYRPKVYGHDYKNLEIISPSHERISCSDVKFNGFASVEITDLIKIATVLTNAKLPKHIRIIIEDYNKKFKQLNENYLLDLEIDSVR